MSHALTLEQISFAYGAHEVLHDVSFSVREGQFLSVLGPNGVGKSTLFRCILGLLSPNAGTIRLSGTNIRQLSAKQLARHIAYIPQTHYPSFRYSVFDMVLMGTTHRVETFSAPKESERELAKNALKEMHIEDLSCRIYSDLSGGEQQLVLIARALAQGSPILLMDEPTASLDYGNQLRVLSCVKSLTKEGRTVIVSTHNPQHALLYADSVLALKDGSVLAFGQTDEVVTETLLQSLYGVETKLVSSPYGTGILPLGGDV